MNCSNLTSSEKKDLNLSEITTLSDCLSHSDSVYVIDNFSYTKRGNLKPPCSISPDYCGCMEARGIIPQTCK